jgi:hypothetical protein
MLNCNDDTPALKEVVGRLTAAGERLTVDLTARKDGLHPAHIIMLGFAEKTKKMLRSLLREVDADAPENSLIQARVLLENLVNFLVFADELKKDLPGAATRFWDAMPLQRAKWLRIVAQHPQAAELSEHFKQEAAEAQAHTAARTGDANAVKAVEKHGFYQKNFEQRCKQVGRQEQYDILYRQCCEPVHAADILECAVTAIEPEATEEVIRGYVTAALAVGHDAGTVVFTFVNAFCKGPVTDELHAIKELSKKLLDETVSPSAGS